MVKECFSATTGEATTWVSSPCQQLVVLRHLQALLSPSSLSNWVLGSRSPPSHLDQAPALLGWGCDEDGNACSHFTFHIC